MTSSEKKQQEFVDWCKTEQEKLYARMYLKARDELEEEESDDEEDVATPNRKRARGDQEVTLEQVKVGYFVYHCIEWGVFKTTGNNSIKIGDAPETFKKMFKEFKLSNPNQAGYRLYKKYEANKEDWDAKAGEFGLDNWIEDLHKKRPAYRPKEFNSHDDDVFELKVDKEHFTKLISVADTHKRYTLEEDNVLKSKQFPKYSIVNIEAKGNPE